MDTELSAWLICPMQISMGLPYSSVTWAVCIDSADGKPFLSTWKGYLGAAASTPVRGERSRPWPATEAAKAGASEGGNGSRSKPEQLFFVLNGHQSSGPACGCLSCWVPSPGRRSLHKVTPKQNKKKKPCLEAVSLG